MSPVLRRAATPPRRRHRVHPLAIAALFIAVTLFITYYAFNQGLPFVHRFTLYAVVNNSVNVRQDSPVRIAGIDVGSVQGTFPDGQATRIAFTVNPSGLPVHSDATLTIRDRLFLEGGYYLALDPGSPSAPTVSDGFTIREQQTSTPVQFYQLLSTFDVATRASLEDLLNTLNTGFSPRSGRPESDSGAGGLKAAIPQLTPALKDVAWISQGLHGTQAGDVETLLASAARVTGTLQDNATPLSDLITSLNRTSSALAAADGALAQSISGVDQTLQVTPAALSSIDHALPPLASLAVALDPSLRAAPPLVDALSNDVATLTSLVAPAARGRLLSTLRTTLTEFPTILTQLASLFPITKQVTDCLRTHVVPIFNERVPDGTLSSGHPVWQDFAHFLPNVAGASGSFDANGHYVRVLAGAGTNSLSGGLLGSLPVVGQLVGSAPPGGTSLLGARPAWIGSLTPQVFHPEARCAAQPLPSLAGSTVAPDLQPRSIRAPAPVARAGFLREVARAARGAGR
ncbi:MAG: MlaD family protein [Solirubrobacteraceae bacterium]